MSFRKRISATDINSELKTQDKYSTKEEFMNNMIIQDIVAINYVDIYKIQQFVEHDSENKEMDIVRGVYVVCLHNSNKKLHDVVITSKIESPGKILWWEAMLHFNHLEFLQFLNICNKKLLPLYPIYDNSQFMLKFNNEQYNNFESCIRDLYHF
jgi:hypothetical protein